MGKARSNVFLYLLVALGVVGPVAIALWAWPHIPSDPVDRAAVIAGLFSRNQTPAVAALRDIGCEHVFVSSMGEIVAAQTSIAPEERARMERSPTRDRPLVTCTDAFGHTPTCEEVAATFARFVPDQDRAIIRVTSRGETVCDGLYATRGEREPAGDAAEPELP